MNELEIEKPFLDRYQQKVAELEEFRTRLLGLLDLVKQADVDTRAVQLAKILKSVTLFLLPRRRWQPTKLDETGTELTFNHAFEGNAADTC
ncbi:MAG: hypothetical protein L0Z62_35000 [Gemmataceae bacterium]|nr:hypothetical protein [Gemmataceae bacterium]